MDEQKMDEQKIDEQKIKLSVNSEYEVFKIMARQFLKRGNHGDEKEKEDIKENKRNVRSNYWQCLYCNQCFNQKYLWLEHEIKFCSDKKDKCLICGFTNHESNKCRNFIDAEGNIIEY